MREKIFTIGTDDTSFNNSSELFNEKAPTAWNNFSKNKVDFLFSISHMNLGNQAAVNVGVAAYRICFAVLMFLLDICNV